MKTIANLNRENATRYRQLIRPRDDAHRPLQFVLAALRDIVADGTSIKLTKRGLMIERLDTPIPTDHITFIIDAASTIAEYLDATYSHQKCGEKSRKSLIGFQRFAVRCCVCKEALRRKPN